MKKSAWILLLCIFFGLAYTPSRASADFNWKFGGTPDKVDLFGKTILNIVFRALTNYNLNIIDKNEYAKKTIMSGTAQILIDLFCKEENRWLITRATVGGIKEDGLMILSSFFTTLFLKDVAKPKTESSAIVKGMMTTTTVSPPATPTGDPVTEESLSLVANALMQLAGKDMLSNPDPDKDSILNLMILAGKALLGLTFMISIVSQILKPALGNGSALRYFDMLRTFAQAIALLIIIIKMPEIIWGCVQISESLRSMVLGGSSTVPFDEALLQQGLLSALDMKAVVAGIRPDQSMWDSMQSGAGAFLTNSLGTSAYMMINVTLYAIEVLADFGVAVTAALGPIAMAFVLLPSVSGFGGYLGQWVKALFGFMLVGPLVVIYKYLGIVLFTATLDTGTPMFLVLAVVYIMVASTIPQMAMTLSGSSVSHAAGGVSHMAGGSLMSGGAGGMMPMGGALSAVGGLRASAPPETNGSEHPVSSAAVNDAPQATTGSRRG